MRAEEGTSATAGPSAEDDAILKAEPREDAGPVGISYGSLSPSEGTSSVPNGPVWGWRNERDGETRYGGWLPSAGPLTPGELLLGIFVAALVCPTVAVSLPLVDTYAQMPEQVVGDETLMSRLCGLACGLFVTLRRRSSRLARRAHLRGEG